jgi:hypothetical protein
MSTTQGYAAPVAIVTDGQTQVHLATRDLDVGFRTNHIVNPLEREASQVLAVPSSPDINKRRQSDLIGIGRADHVDPHLGKRVQGFV